jgi:hypothetical protein
MGDGLFNAGWARGRHFFQMSLKLFRKSGEIRIAPKKAPSLAPACGQQSEGHATVVKFTNVLCGNDSFELHSTGTSTAKMAGNSAVHLIDPRRSRRRKNDTILFHFLTVFRDKPPL